MLCLRIFICGGMLLFYALFNSGNIGTQDGFVDKLTVVMAIMERIILRIRNLVVRERSSKFYSS